MKKLAKLTLVGAGPGDVDLITLKGIKAIKEADVVLYDALVNPELLEYAPSKSPKIYVGKRCGQNYLKQEEINQLILDYALEYGHVVRLKGGDPFVFGRGMEEIEFVEAYGIETTVIPGISSALAVPALKNIPLTHRGLSESFWVITGTTKSHEISGDVALAAQSTATVVILMGVNQLAEIVKIFQNVGKINTPVAIIQNGSTQDERIVLGTISNINEIAEEQAVASPAIIVIGEVVSKAKEWHLMKELAVKEAVNLNYKL